MPADSFSTCLNLRSQPPERTMLDGKASQTLGAIYGIAASLAL